MLQQTTLALQEPASKQAGQQFAMQETATTIAEIAQKRKMKHLIQLKQLFYWQK